MPTAVSWDTAKSTARPAESPSGSGATFQRCDYLGPENDFYAMSKAQRLTLFQQLQRSSEAPHAFMLQQAPNCTVPAHFHRVPQYQIVVEGGGKLGRHEVDAVAFHYADEYTAYGPIISGNDGLWYCTLRTYFDPGANYVGYPGVKELLQPSRKRYLLAGGEQTRLSTAPSLAARTAPALETVIAPHDDGVAAWMLRLGPRQSLAAPAPAAGGGQYVVVLNGDLLHDGKRLDRHSLVWIAASDAPLTVIAGAQGAECALLQFPLSLHISH